jgi:hypothetical protein
MGATLFRCPNTGLSVQGWFADDGSENGSNGTYEMVSCLACAQMHFVNPKTGKTLGVEEEE